MKSVTQIFERQAAANTLKPAILTFLEENRGYLMSIDEIVKELKSTTAVAVDRATVTVALVQLRDELKIGTYKRRWEVL